jgi:FAD:protein FMN transferase
LIGYHQDSRTAGKKAVLSFLQKYRLLIIFVLAVSVLLLLLVSSNPAVEMKAYHLTAMDTMVEVNIIVPEGVEAEAVKNAVLSEIEHLERLISRTVADSDINRVNSLAGIEPVVVNPDTYQLVELAYQYAVISNGAFDPTIGPLIDSWGFLGQEYRIPDEAEIIKLLPLVDYHRISFDQTKTALYLTEQGMVLEPGGLAKGFILDQVIALLIKSGVSSAFINAGGDIALLGNKPDGELWKLGIRHPRDRKKIIAVLNVAGGAVVTSGDYERSFDRAGVVYHHILDPKTGKPAYGLVSVSILAATAAGADALSTAVFVLGPEEGLTLIEALPGVEGVLITPELELIVSSGLEGIIDIQ